MCEMRRQSPGYRICALVWCLLLLVKLFMQPSGNWGHAVIVGSLLAPLGMFGFMYVDRRKVSR
jgi:hypothetical protein